MPMAQGFGSAPYRINGKHVGICKDLNRSRRRCLHIEGCHPPLLGDRVGAFHDPNLAEGTVAHFHASRQRKIHFHTSYFYTVSKTPHCI